jgi:transcriptional regulator with XRE-family HTH domain
LMNREKLGLMMRTRRKAHGMSLDDLARATGLSKSFLSEVERGECSISIENFYGIAHALGNRPSQFLEAFEEKVVFRSKDAEFLPLEKTLRCVSLTHREKSKLEPLLFVLDVGANTKAHKHNGSEEFCYVIEGKLRFYHGTDAFDLVAGDAAHFDSQIEHHIENIGATPARYLVVHLPDSAGATDKIAK